MDVESRIALKEEYTRFVGRKLLFMAALSLGIVMIEQLICTIATHFRSPV